MVRRVKSQLGFERVRSRGTGTPADRERQLGRTSGFGTDNPTPVVGGLLNTRTIQTGRKLVAAANVAVKLDAPCIAVPDGFSLVIVALAANAGEVFVGNKESRQFPLAAGEGIAVAVMHSHYIWIDAANIGDGVKYVVESDLIIH